MSAESRARRIDGEAAERVYACTARKAIVALSSKKRGKCKKPAFRKAASAHLAEYPEHTDTFGGHAYRVLDGVQWSVTEDLKLFEDV